MKRSAWVALAAISLSSTLSAGFSLGQIVNAPPSTCDPDYARCVYNCNALYANKQGYLDLCKGSCAYKRDNCKAAEARKTAAKKPPTSNTVKRKSP